MKPETQKKNRKRKETVDPSRVRDWVRRQDRRLWLDPATQNQKIKSNQIKNSKTMGKKRNNCRISEMWLRELADAILMMMMQRLRGLLTGNKELFST